MVINAHTMMVSIVTRINKKNLFLNKKSGMIQYEVMKYGSVEKIPTIIKIPAEVLNSASSGIIREITKNVKSNHAKMLSVTGVEK